MSEEGTAVLRAVVAILVVLLTQRSSGIAAADRLAEPRSTLYLDVARWLQSNSTSPRSSR